MTKTLYAKPPEYLLTPCEYKKHEIKTNGELLNAYIEMGKAFNICANKHQTLIEYTLSATP
mgnify:CR=1 FL=1